VPNPRIQVKGLRELQRDLRKLQPAAGKELRGELRKGAGTVATAARPKAPVATGKLAASYRAGATNRGAFVRSRLPYAAIHEYGGTINPKGTTIHIRESAPIRKAIDAKANQIVDDIADGIERLAKRHGWR
jgi:phage gpG-like protein